MNSKARARIRKLIRALDGPRGLERLESMGMDDEGFGYDRFGFERESLYAGYLFARQLYRRWFRVDSRGHENVPRSGRAILAGNHSGLLPFDGAMLAVDLLEKLEPPRPLRSIVDHFAFALPFVGQMMYRTGQVPGTPRNFRDLLEREQLVLVFPEGTKGIVKPFSERYQLRPFNVGFVEIALEAEAPIVPFAVIGAEEQAPVLFSIPLLGKRFGMPTFPITPTFPWLGVAGLVPYPVKYRIAYGEPLLLHREYPKESARDPDVVRAISEKVRSRVQGMIDLGLELRKSKGLVGALA
ncbi:MAG TPA: lysophospholipid acyltransferase family protein [Planctomycetota bacterium]|nr:lysophospholipid acyltransferase family protein [Planctomycetota bacterium]